MKKKILVLMLDGKYDNLFNADIKRFQNNEIGAEMLNKKYEMYLTYGTFIEESNTHVFTILPLMSLMNDCYNENVVLQRLEDFDKYMKNQNTLHIMDILLKKYYPNSDDIKYMTISKNSFQQKVNTETKNFNLNWLKNQIDIYNNTNQLVETKYGNLLVVDMIAYGNAETIKKIQQQIPANSWVMFSDKTPPMRQQSTATSNQSSYDAEYMRNYYQVLKADKYKMKIKIQTEAYKAGMSYGTYRKQYYPNFTFKDEKIKFSVVTTTVQDLLTAYLNVPI